MYKCFKQETKEKFEERSKIAESKGFTYLGRAVELDNSLDQSWGDYGVYKNNKCGHTRVVCHKNFSRLKTDFCIDCVNEFYIKYVEDLGLEFIEFTRPTKNGTNYISVKLPCGHFKSIQTGNLKSGAFRCTECLLDSYVNTCKSYGMTYVKPISDSKHEVILPCGCSDVKHLTNIKLGGWSCEKHKMSSLDNIGYIYLFKITYQETEWLKIGYSVNYNERVKSFSDFDLSTELLLVRKFDSGRIAVKEEKEFHKNNKTLKINNAAIKQYMQSGFTECYDIKHLDVLTEKLLNIGEDVEENHG